MRKTLVAYATKHGSTAEIAEMIGIGLRDGDQEVDVLPAGEVVVGPSACRRPMRR